MHKGGGGIGVWESSSASGTFLRAMINGENHHANPTPRGTQVDPPRGSGCMLFAKKNSSWKEIMRAINFE